MKSIAMAAALLVTAIPVEAAPDDTFKVTVTVSGMSWAENWGSAIKKALAGLDGSAKVEEVSFKKNVGVYSVLLPETAKFDPAAVKKAIGKFTLDRIDLKIKGEVAKDDKGVWLTSPSGAKLLLVNRPKKDDKDTPPDVLAKIEEGLKARKTTFAVSGQVRESKDATSVELESAEVVEKKKKED